MLGFLKRLFGWWDADLAEAVFQDASEAFARFAAAHGQDHITAFAACTVDDASPPYYMGATLESGFGPVGSLTYPGEEKSHGWNADPADGAGATACALIEPARSAIRCAVT